MTPRLSLIIVLLLAGTADGQATTSPGAVTPVAHVEVRGTGPTKLILVPGLSCDWRVYDAFMTRNASKYTMLAVTLPGFGGSEPPPKELDWIDNAERAIVQMMHDRDIDHPIIVGHSLGGHIALRLAIHHPEQFRAAISIDGLPLFPVPQPGQPDTAATRQAMAKAISDRIMGMTDEQAAQMPRRTFAAMVSDPKRAEELAEMYGSVPRTTSLQYMCELITTDLRPAMKDVKIPLLTISAVSLEMGNSPQVVKDHYFEIVDEKAAREYWSIKPLRKSDIPSATSPFLTLAHPRQTVPHALQ
jgi:pimeloyl-ACP methyl ester carboxylesterase